MPHIFLTPIGVYVLSMYYAHRGELFEKYRFHDLIRYDETPNFYRQRYLIIIKPKKRDRAFRVAQDEMVDLPVLDYDTENGIAEHPSFTLKVPRVYLIHLWRLQVEAKFWLEIPDGRGHKLGHHLCRVVDDFVEEWSSFMTDQPVDDPCPEWRSVTLTPIIFRTFHEIHEHDINSDIAIIERLVRKEKLCYERLATRGGTSLALERVGEEEVTDEWIETVYLSKDLLDVKYQNAWRRKVSRRPLLRWFMRKARLLVDQDGDYKEADFHALLHYVNDRSVHVPVSDTDDTLSDAPDCETDSEYCSEQSDVEPDSSHHPPYCSRTIIETQIA